MASKFIINEGYASEKTVDAAKYIHQDGLWTFLDHNARQVYSLAAGSVITVERKDEAKA